ncbi:hypothetical protein Tdes44962_MAKER08243 [Teratosphaeria destructans]|uniref:Uncharacterized protein n=1 Tax=Teratosphaeria destructans TaxID=418781 RepID=A0A9W7SX28_9PEZI|nr:hypothetical protein Tdes44962_MAKER08243 [Teratosphaeria destructans]
MSDDTKQEADRAMFADRHGDEAVKTEMPDDSSSDKQTADPNPEQEPLSADEILACMKFIRNTTYTIEELQKMIAEKTGKSTGSSARTLLKATIAGREAYRAMPSNRDGIPLVILEQPLEPAIVMLDQRSHANVLSTTVIGPAVALRYILPHRVFRWHAVALALSVIALAYGVQVIWRYFAYLLSSQSVAAAAIYSDLHSVTFPRDLSFLPGAAILALGQWAAVSDMQLRWYGHRMTETEIQRRGANVLAVESTLRQAEEAANYHTQDDIPSAALSRFTAALRDRRERKFVRNVRTQIAYTLVQLYDLDPLGEAHSQHSPHMQGTRSMEQVYLDIAVKSLVGE